MSRRSAAGSYVALAISVASTGVTPLSRLSNFFTLYKARSLRSAGQNKEKAGEAQRRAEETPIHDCALSYANKVWVGREWQLTFPGVFDG